MPDNRTPGRIEQITASFRALGCDSVNTYWDSEDQLTHCVAVWHDESDRPPVVVHLKGKQNDITLMVLAGQEMSRRLAEERPDLTFPDIVWT
jgi:hypothetical protein